MREKRGPLARTVGAVTEGLQGAAKRRQSEREGRAMLYDEHGRPTLVTPGTAEHAALVDTADQLLGLLDDGRRRGSQKDAGEPAEDAPEGAPEAENGV
jgi:hypothetical protein